MAEESSVSLSFASAGALENTSIKPKLEVKNPLPVAVPSAPRLPVAEISKRGREIYETVRAEMEQRHHGEYLLIDTETGKSVHAPDLRTAHVLMNAVNPTAVPYCIHIGHRSVTKA